MWITVIGVNFLNKMLVLTNTDCVSCKVNIYKRISILNLLK